MTNIPTFNDKDYISINGVGIDQITHPHFEAWFKYIIETYQPPEGKTGVFVTCAAIKPYYNSPIHKAFNSIIDKYSTHKIVISNAGVIPYEFADHYPFNVYDWNPYHETDEIRDQYVQITAERIVSFLNKHATKYRGFASYLRSDSDDLMAVKIASQITGINIVNVDVDNHKLIKSADFDLVLIFENNLEKLRRTLESIS